MRREHKTNPARAGSVRGENAVRVERLRLGSGLPIDTQPIGRKWSEPVGSEGLGKIRQAFKGRPQV